MALLSHIVSMTTNPGVLPKNYRQLNPYKLTLKYAKLLEERDVHHVKPLVRKLTRTGEKEKAAEMERAQEEASIYRRIKERIGVEEEVTTDG